MKDFEKQIALERDIDYAEKKIKQWTAKKKREQKKLQTLNKKWSKTK